VALLVYQAYGSYTGVLPTLSAATTSDTVPPDEHGYLWYKSTQGTTEVITVVTPSSLNNFGQTLPDIAVTIGATTGEEVIGPLMPSLADPATGLITITIADVTGITVAAVRG
jgi:hypothetical protein